MGEKISVIIPIYKVEAYLSQCLDSVTGQTYRDLEILLIDDGSPDGCGKICDAYAEKDARIRVVHKENEGLSAARNDGMKLASGEWIAFVDSDDWCEPDYYEKLVLTAKREAADVCYATGYILETEGRDSRKIFQFPGAFSCSDEERVREFMIKAITSGGRKTAAYGFPWDKLYRTAFLKKNKLIFDTRSRAVEDAWFNFQVFHKAKSVAGCVTAGYHYRFVPQSITRGFNPHKAGDVYAVLANLHAYVDRNPVPASVREAVDCAGIGLLSTALNCSYFHPANPKKYREVAAEIKDVKTWPYFHEAIWSKGSRYLNSKQVVLKFACRLPWIWPIRLLHVMKQKIQ